MVRKHGYDMATIAHARHCWVPWVVLSRCLPNVDLEVLAAHSFSRSEVGMIGASERRADNFKLEDAPAVAVTTGHKSGLDNPGSYGGLKIASPVSYYAQV